ncbi:MAG: rubrerythrin-like domain-containing protein [Halobacteriales archaeon]|nr:rubrerythrin-like domain-containing protein [Halobacteriales archaeon]
MHTSTITTTRALHECFTCGRRVRDPDTRECSSCGGQLRNLSRPRDL